MESLQAYRPFAPSFIQSVLKDKGLWLSKNRGQNYLIDPHAAEKMVESVPEGLPVFEVGSGLGALTHLLMEKHSTVSIELDAGIFRLLSTFLSYNKNLTLIHADFLEFDFQTLPESGYYFISNLPYSISGEAIRVFIDCPKFNAGIVMLQEEFVERMAAATSSGGYGVFSILCQTYLEVESLFSVGRNSFFPAPTVDSAVVMMRKKKSLISQKEFQIFLRGAFQSRRKTIANNLKKMGIGREQLVKSGIRPEARPEEIAVEDWGKMFMEFGQN